MSELNMSSFIQTMQLGLVQNRTQESAGVFLLNAINEQEYVEKKGYRTDNLSSKKISRIVSRIDSVPEGIIQASLMSNVANETYKYFQDEVMNDLNPYLLEETLNNIANLITNDITVPDTKKENLLNVYKTGDYSKFLADVFLYVVNRQNKKINSDVECDDIPLLDEVNYKCPLCHVKLVDNIKGKPIKKYCITKIFPDDLNEETISLFNEVYKAPQRKDSLDNMIALDERCSYKYILSPTVEEYTKLYELKERLKRDNAIKEAVNSIKLEDDIRTILDALSKIHCNSELVKLDYKALHLEDKIEPANFIMKNDIQLHVLTYYRYIEKLFSENTENFDEIASEIKLSFQKLEKIGMSQEEIFENLSEWIRSQSGLDQRWCLACKIVVSFFVQNCEVFHK